MVLLGIETTGPFCSAALRIGDETHELISEKKLNHLASLTPMIRQLSEEEQVDLKKLDAICVSEGPGSFTGIRIGVSTGRAMSQILNIPIVSVPTLFAFARSIAGKAEEMYSDKNSIKAETERESEKFISCPIFNARRNQIYGAAYSGNTQLVEDGPYILDEFLERMKIAAKKKYGKIDESRICFAGDGVDAYEEFLKDRIPKAILWKVYQRASGICDTALYMFSHKDEFQSKLNLNPCDLKPNYMRMAEAQRKLMEGKL